MIGRLSRFSQACLLGALVATPVGAAVQSAMQWRILHVDTSTHWTVDAAIYALSIAVIACLAGALGLPLRGLARRFLSAGTSVLATLLSAGVGLVLFTWMISWPLSVAEHLELLLVLASFYAVFFAWLRPARVSEDPAPRPEPT